MRSEILRGRLAWKLYFRLGNRPRVKRAWLTSPAAAPQQQAPAVRWRPVRQLARVGWAGARLRDYLTSPRQLGPAAHAS